MRLRLWLGSGLLLLIFALGARSLDADAIWGDEYFSVYDAGGMEAAPLSPADIWGRVGDRNPWHAPGYFLLLGGWAALVGWEPAVLRALSLLLALLAAAWTFRLGREVINERAGLVAAAVLGTSPFFIHYAHELRMYTLIVLLSALTLTCYARIVRSGAAPPGKAVWFGLFFGAVGLLYVHYFAALPLAAIGLYHLFLPRKDARWWRVVGVLVLAGLLFLPWVGMLRAALELAGDAETLQSRALDSRETLERLLPLAGSGSPLLLALTLAVAAVARLRRQRGATWTWFFALALLGLLLATNAVVRVMHEGRLRYLILLWAPLALLVALAVETLVRNPRSRLGGALLAATWIVVGTAGVLSGGLTANLDGSAYRAPLHQLERRLGGRVQPGDFVVYYPPDNLATWRYRVPGDFYLAGLGDGYSIVNVLSDDAAQPAETPAQTLMSLGERQRVWLGYNTAAAEQPAALDDFRTRMESDYHLCSAATPSTPVMVELYARSPVCCVDNRPANPLARFGDGILLSGMSALPASAADRLDLLLGWWLEPQVPAYTFSFALHVVGADDTLAAQTDMGLAPQQFACVPVQLDLSTVPAGAYRLYLIVYRWQDGARLTPIPRDGVETAADERLLLGEFRVQRAPVLED